MPRIQKTQRGLIFNAYLAQALQVFVVAVRLEGLVVEILHRLVVQQRINGSRVGAGISGVHGTAKLGSPLSDHDGERDVQHECSQRNEHVAGVEGGAQNHEHKRHLYEGGDDAVKRVRNERLHAARTPLNVARHATRLSRQVKTQAQAVQVFENLQGDMACRPFRCLGKHQFAGFGKQGG